jgi:hypothetical protein
MKCEKCGDFEFRLFVEAMMDCDLWRVDNAYYLDMKHVVEWVKEWDEENGSFSAPR